jgi:hypothetical protein
MANRPFSLVPREQQIKLLKRRYLILTDFIRNRLFKLKRYDANKAKIIIREINEKIIEINKFTAKWLEQNIDIHYNKAFNSMYDKWKTKGFDDNKKVDSDKNKKARLKDAKKRFKNSNDSIMQRVEEYFALVKKTEKAVKVQFLQGGSKAFKQTEKIIKRGVVAGSSRNKIAENIQDLYIKKFGKVDFVEITSKSGKVIRYTPEYYSEMVARTELKTMETQATIDATVAAGGDLVMFSEHANPCEICAQYEGNIYSISGNHPVYPQIDQPIPVHPNCEHYYIPVTDPAIKAMKKAGKKVNPPTSLSLVDALINIKKVKEGKTKGIAGRLVGVIGTVLTRRKKEKEDD